ncbi:MAG TPA: hypothetical protein H9672_04850 [Firmicutes bacterium]|nr:hypothetical protein [Bacillota bacterium]
MAFKILKQMIEESQKIMVFSGMGLVRESGIPYFRDEPYAYQIETKYGVSPEEFLSTAYYSSRPGAFYSFYKNEVLKLGGEPNAAHYALAKLEKLKEKAGGSLIVATRTISSFHQRAGVKNVIELHGNIYNNHCIQCGKEFSPQYILESHGIPHCDECQGAIRPGILLAGERLDNGLISKVADETEKADMLLVIGTHLDAYLTKRFRNYYEGERLVLITNETHPTDREANMVIYEKASDVLPKIVDEIERDTAAEQDSADAINAEKN